MKVQQIVDTAERRLVKARLDELHRTQRKLTRQRGEILDSLNSRLSTEDFTMILTLTDDYSSKTHARTKKTQQTKFARLRTEYAARTRKTSGFETENVINLSQRQLSDDERAVLAKGLNFAVPPKKTPTLDIIAGVEKGLRRIRDQNSANYIRMLSDRHL